MQSSVVPVLIDSLESERTDTFPVLFSVEAGLLGLWGLRRLSEGEDFRFGEVLGGQRFITWVSRVEAEEIKISTKPNKTHSGQIRV